MRTRLIAALGLVAASTAAAAPQGMASLRIDNAVARVVVIPEARRDIDVVVRQGRGGFPPLKTMRLGPSVTIDGGIRQGGAMSKMAFWSRTECGPGRALKVAGRPVRREDLPTIVARVPQNVRVATSGMVFGEIGPAVSLSLTTNGCGDWKAGRVNGPLDVSSAGGGRVEIAGGFAPRAELTAGGTGDVIFRGQVGQLNAHILSTGAVEVAAVRGSVEAEQRGKGDLRYSRAR